MKNLLEDLKTLGLPKIHNYYHGFYYCIKPNAYEVDQGFNQNLRFIIADNGYFVLSFYDATLRPTPRPSNLIISCKKCYEIYQIETGCHLGYIYWPD